MKLNVAAFNFRNGDISLQDLKNIIREELNDFLV